MRAFDREVLEQVLHAAHEATMVVRLDHTDWPVELVNTAFEAIAGGGHAGLPFADVVEKIVGREVALEISEALRSQQETSFPVEAGGRDYLLVLSPLMLAEDERAEFCAVFWRTAKGGAVAGDGETRQALLNAKRRIRDLSRDDPVTGLLNGKAFREVLEHDWAVAARDKGKIALVLFTLDDFDAYVEVFGRHASDSCLRRVGQAIRRCLRRASDVAARLDGARLVVLSHASDEAGVRDFADKISTAIRELGLHHPRSSHGRFVTASYDLIAGTAGEAAESWQAFLGRLIDHGQVDEGTVDNGGVDEKAVDN